MMWMRYSNWTEDGIYQQGSLFDCGLSMGAKLNGKSITMVIYLNNTGDDGQPKALINSTQLDVEVPFP